MESNIKKAILGSIGRIFEQAENCKMKLPAASSGVS